jgi:hypothetical protein
LKENEKFESKSFKKFIPDSVLDWKRIQDREAGEDEGLSVTDSFVRDTHLVKAKTSAGNCVAVKTSGSDTLLDVIRTNKDLQDPSLWQDVFSRIEYLSSTLSVKKIRLLLEGLSTVSHIRDVPSELVRSSIEALGQELLCRYHSLTLLSCSSIAHALSVIPGAKHEGTLNILALAFQQNLVEDSHDLTDRSVIEMTRITLRAFGRLEYPVPVVVESAIKALEVRNRSLSLEDRIDVIELLLSSHPENLVKEGPSVMSVSVKELNEASVDIFLRFLALVSSTNHEGLRKAASQAVKERVKVSDQGISLRDMKLVQGVPISTFVQVLDPTLISGFLDRPTIH